MKKLTQSELDKILDDHFLWAMSVNDWVGKRAKLTDHDLRGLEFKSRKLINKKFDYRGTLESGDVVITDTEGSCINMQEINFFGSNLSGVKIINANLRRCHFDYCYMTGADFTSSAFSGSSLVGADLSHANFSKTLLYRRDFRHCDLTHANFTDANKMGADFDE